MTDKPQDILFKDKTIHVYGTLEDMKGILYTLSQMEMQDDVKVYFNNELYIAPTTEPKLELAPIGPGDYKLVDTSKLKPGDEFYELCHDTLLERIRRKFKKEKKD